MLVDRGWIATDNRGATPDDVPAAAGGRGHGHRAGYARDAEGDSTGSPTSPPARSTASGSARRSTARCRRLRRPRVGVPEPADPLLPVELPELDNGPHFFYGLQWWFFGALAIFGFCYLVYDEWRGAADRGHDPRRGRAAQSARSMPPSTGSITPVTNDAAGDSRNAATAPNSSGSP